MNMPRRARLSPVPMLNSSSLSLQCVLVARPVSVRLWALADLSLSLSQVVIIDCGSHHGTWVTPPGGPTTKLAPATPHVLQNGDVIQFGKAVTKAGQQYEPLQVQVKLLTAADLPSSPYKAR